VEEIARSVSRWLRKREAKALNIVSILEGAKPFTRDLMDVLKIIEPDLHLELHEIRMKGTDGHQHLLKDREWQSGSLNNLEHIQKYPVLIVDDLVDSGLTLAALKQVLASQSIEVKTAVLIRKFGEASGPVDFFGFDLKWSQQVLAQKGFRDCWLYGYGMDLDGQKRELRQIEGVYIPLE
jgi:hypoxanthine-guanine phosphoribosyltransferase